MHIWVRFKGEENEEKFDINIDGFFLAIGHTPNTDLFKGQLEMDDHGFIITKPKSTATNIEGVYAAGDVADRTYRQGVVAAGTGAMAAIEVDRFCRSSKQNKYKEGVFPESSKLDFDAPFIISCFFINHIYKHNKLCVTFYPYCAL